MRGQVTVTKIFKDGTREEVLSEECNILTDGLGISMVNMWTSNALLFRGGLEDFQFKYFQLGTSGVVETTGMTMEEFEDWESTLPTDVENNFYELHSPIDFSGYGSETTVHVDTKKIITVDTPWLPPEELTYKYTEQPVAYLERASTTKFVDDAIHIKINLDEGAAVGKSIKELGLFVKNPRVFKSDDRPVLGAYKLLYTPINKTDEFSIDIDWSIGFE